MATRDEIRATTAEWMQTARSYALHANQAGSYDDVLAYLAQAMSDTAETARAKGEALLAWRPADAEPLLRSALLEDPKDVEALGLLARCLIAQGRLDEAVEYASEAIAAEPDDPDGHYLLALSRIGNRNEHERVRELLQPGPAPMDVRRAGVDGGGANPGAVA